MSRSCLVPMKPGDDPVHHLFNSISVRAMLNLFGCLLLRSRLVRFCHGPAATHYGSVRLAGVRTHEIAHCLALRWHYILPEHLASRSGNVSEYVARDHISSSRWSTRELALLAIRQPVMLAAIL